MRASNLARYTTHPSYSYTLPSSFLGSKQQRMSAVMKGKGSEKRGEGGGGGGGGCRVVVEVEVEHIQSRKCARRQRIACNTCAPPRPPCGARPGRRPGAAGSTTLFERTPCKIQILPCPLSPPGPTSHPPSSSHPNAAITHFLIKLINTRAPESARLGENRNETLETRGGRWARILGPARPAISLSRPGPARPAILLQ